MPPQDKQKAKLEEIAQSMLKFKDGEELSISINPADERQGYQNNQFKNGRRWDNVRKNVIQYLSRYAPTIERLELYPDISFPQLVGNAKPRIHYHGIIEFLDVVGFLTSHVDVNHMSTDIDTIEDRKIWKAYCEKFIKVQPSYSDYKITLDDIVQQRKKDQKKETNDKANIMTILEEFRNEQ